MLNLNEEENYFRICEWLAQLFLPSFYSSVKAKGFVSLFEFLSSHSKKLLANEDLLNNNNCSIFQHLTLDVASYVSFCYRVESNLVYFEWLFSIFQPLLYTLISLFLLPAIIVIFLYASSFFLFVSKHWNKLKVSY